MLDFARKRKANPLNTDVCLILFAYEQQMTGGGINSRLIMLIKHSHTHYKLRRHSYHLLHILREWATLSPRGGSTRRTSFEVKNHCKVPKWLEGLQLCWQIRHLQCSYSDLTTVSALGILLRSPEKKVDVRNRCKGLFRGINCSCPSVGTPRQN